MLIAIRAEVESVDHWRENLKHMQIYLRARVCLLLIWAQQMIKQ